LNEKIAKQGDIVRNLKTQKAAKADIDAAVKSLLDLKAEYKSVTGQDWKPGQEPPKTAAKTASVGQVSDINEKINQQGDVVRNLKTQKAAKQDIDVAVKLLLDLKAEYKSATGQDWKPGATPASAPQPKPASVGQVSDINEKINQQGDIVRNLKSQKAAKGDIDAAVKILLELKAEYKKTTGQEWKPGAQIVPQEAPKTASVGQVSDINEKINQQGDIVRNLKSQKAAKGDIDAAVKILLELKAEYKKTTGQEWKPGAQEPPKAAPKQASIGQVSDLNEKIIRQGDSVRNLKSQKAAKGDIDAAVKILLELKTEYKKVSGEDWKPQPAAPMTNKENMAPATASNSIKDELTKKINDQGNLVRTLKSNKATPKADVDAAVQTLLTLKAEYKTATGEDFPAAGRQPAAPKQSQPKEKKAPEPKKAAPVADDAAGKKQTRLGLEAKKEENLPDWYSQVITKGEMIEYYDVSGCYILRPWAFAIWKNIKKWFDAQITDMGVKECYFPMFVSKAALEKEKDHIADFAPVRVLKIKIN
jgi:bifunctional glutamyl/prolyl-tRNA synthetase